MSQLADDLRAARPAFIAIARLCESMGSDVDERFDAVIDALNRAGLPKANPSAAQVMAAIDAAIAAEEAIANAETSHAE